MCSLYTVDDIAAIADAGREERRAAAETAEGIIQEKPASSANGWSAATPCR
ncbi:MAG: hypothetical protein U1E47_07205 [Rivihabitans pingtungensis]